MENLFIGNDAQAIRYASAIAAAGGLQTSVEVAKCLHLDGQPEIPCHVWRGTAEQFQRLWFFGERCGKFDTMKKRRWIYPRWLRGHIYRDGPDAYRFVIEFGYGLTPQMTTGILQQASSDAGFKRFVKAMLTKVELHDEES